VAIKPTARLRNCPEDQIGVSIPRPLNARLDALVFQANESGENTSRKELLAALLLAAPESDELVALVRAYRTAVAKDAALEGQPAAKVLDDRDLVVETESEKEFKNLARDLLEHFQDQVDLERI